jgi:hypothetical protein
LSSDNIGSACVTLPNCDCGAAPTRCVSESSHEFRMRRFELRQPIEQRIVSRRRNFRIVEDVITVVVVTQRSTQRVDFVAYLAGTFTMNQPVSGLRAPVCAKIPRCASGNVQSSAPS